MNTTRHHSDEQWELWGSRDPYFGVITDPRYRLRNLTEPALREFFETGEWQIQHVMNLIRHHIAPAFAPRRALDFGCGVGRTLIPIARIVELAVGVDVSPSMLSEARANCHSRGLRNIELVPSDGDLSAVQGQYDLIHSSIVFQHIPEPRGRRLFARLVSLLSPGGVGALHVTYAKSLYDKDDGVPPDGQKPPSSDECAPSPGADEERHVDPLMEMNAYSLNQLMYQIQRTGVTRLMLDFTDHGGELGVFLYFQRPERAPAPGPA